MREVVNNDRDIEAQQARYLADFAVSCFKDLLGNGVECVLSKVRFPAVHLCWRQNGAGAGQIAERWATTISMTFQMIRIYQHIWSI